MTVSTSPRSRVIRVVAPFVLLLALAGCSSSSDPKPAGSAAVKITADSPAPSGDIDSVTWAVYAEPLSLEQIEQSVDAINRALPEITRDLQRAQQSIQRALSNMPDPNYPRR